MANRWEIAKRFQLAREDHELTQTDAAAALGVSLLTIRRLENAFCLPSAETLWRYSEAYNLRMEWFLEP